MGDAPALASLLDSMSLKPAAVMQQPDKDHENDLFADQDETVRAVVAVTDDDFDDLDAGFTEVTDWLSAI